MIALERMSDHKHHDETALAILQGASEIKEGLLAVARSIGELNSKPECNKPKVNLWLFQTGHDEPIEKVITMEVTLSKPIKPGFRRAFTVGMDEPVDAQPDGSFATSEVTVGDSRAAEILPTSTNKQLNGWIYGDGSIGAKQDRIVCDGHVGAGEVPFELLINYEVQSPDATAFTDFKEGADEAIPTT